MGESAATISRAVERGWVILQEESRRPLERKVALTDEGRRVARKGRSVGRPRLGTKAGEASQDLGPPVGPVRLGGLARIAAYQLNNGEAVFWLRKPPLRSTREAKALGS